MPAPKKSSALHYLIAVALVAVAVGLYFFLRHNHVVSSANVHSHTENLVKVDCVRCENDPVEKKTCEKCGQTGFIWVDPKQVDISVLQLAE